MSLHRDLHEAAARRTRFARPSAAAGGRRRRSHTSAEPPAPYAPWRVFLSYTTELRDHPRDRSFVAAAEAAVIRAGHAVAHMAYFAAYGHASSIHCVRTVAQSDVYVGLVGGRYGMAVRDRPQVSYTELEFETAKARSLTRLVFLVDPDSPHLPAIGQSSAEASRQLRFRQRLQDDAITVGYVSSPAELELALYQALVELRMNLL